METEQAPLNPPKYWKYEQSTALAPAVQRYLTAEPLMQGEIQEIARYLRNWIGSPAWDRLRGHFARALSRAAEISRHKSHVGLEARPLFHVPWP